MTEERGVRPYRVRYRDPETGEMVTRDIRDLPPGFDGWPRAPGDGRCVVVTYHEAPAVTKAEEMKDKAGRMIWTSSWPRAPGDGKHIPTSPRCNLPEPVCDQIADTLAEIVADLENPVTQPERRAIREHLEALAQALMQKEAQL